MIYLDVDGVLADFESWVYSVDPTFTKEDWMKKGRVTQVMIDNYETCFRNSARTIYFDHLKKLYDDNLGNVKLLTAVGDWWPTKEMRERAEYNKLVWAYNNEFNRTDLIIVSRASDKIPFCRGPEDVLYDDRRPTIEAWIEKGGSGIYIVNPARPW